LLLLEKTARRQDIRERIETHRHRRIVRLVDVLTNQESSSRQLLCVLVLSLGQPDLGQTGEDDGHLGVVSTERLLLEGEEAHEQRRRRDEVVPAEVESGETVDRDGDLWVLLAEVPLADGERPLEERFGLIDVFLQILDLRETGDARGEAKVILAQRVSLAHGRNEFLLGGGVVTLAEEPPAGFVVAFPARLCGVGHAGVLPTDGRGRAC
jgi:hypothetical protein